MRDILDARKRGDLAFRDKDFKTALDCYSLVRDLFNSPLKMINLKKGKKEKEERKKRLKKIFTYIKIRLL